MERSEANCSPLCARKHGFQVHVWAADPSKARNAQGSRKRARSNLPRTPGLKKAVKGGDSESEEVIPMEDESDDAANGDVDGNVILFFMELHPKVHIP